MLPRSTGGLPTWKKTWPLPRPTPSAPAWPNSLTICVSSALSSNRLSQRSPQKTLALAVFFRENPPVPKGIQGQSILPGRGIDVALQAVCTNGETSAGWEMTDAVIYEAGWTLDDVQWTQFDSTKVNPALLAAVKAASLVEFNAHDYVAYLKRVYRDASE